MDGDNIIGGRGGVEEITGRPGFDFVDGGDGFDTCILDDSTADRELHI